MAKPYRPSNGTEGDIFHAHWCARCTKAKPGDPCMIAGSAFFHDIGDPEYPKEWVTDEKGPRCTAFTDKVQMTKADVAYLAWLRDRDAARAAQGEV